MSKSNIRNLFSSFTITLDWFDLTAIHQIDKVRRAKIELVDRGHGDHYRGLRVQIIGKQDGEIDRKAFWFDDYLPCRQRKDQHPDYSNKFEIIGYVKWDWYIAVPTTTKPLTDAIEQYIELYR